MNKSNHKTPSSCGFTRREVFILTGWSALGWMLTGQPIALNAVASEEAKEAPLQPLNRFSRMVQEYFVDRIRQLEQKSLAKKNELKTKEDAEAYIKSIREKIQTCFGSFPEKTPLNPRITGVVERDAYKIEKVIFESRPNFLVTANLYIPKGRNFPLPGVVGTCGHSETGKAIDVYQSFVQGLARQGYVVLIFDPISQGERLQYVDNNLKSRKGAGVMEHLYAGNQQFLVGEFFGAWRAWDGIRALDYLLSREEVDPRFVGVTGNSGGGTMTTWLCGVESRWTMAAPSCFVTTFRRNLENELPADTEQCPPQALALGLDHDDFIAATAPKPVILLGQEKDYFDARGLEEANSRLRRLYRLLGEEEKIGLFIGPHPHGYAKENREAMYRWFNRVTHISEAQTEPELTIEKDETLRCTPKGQVAELNSRTVFSFTKEKSQELAKQRKLLTGDELKQAVRKVLKFPDYSGVPEYRILRPSPDRKYPQSHAACYAVETEPGIQALVYRLSDTALASRPPKGQNRAVLYVSHLSSDAELREEPLIQELLLKEPDSAFYTCDVRGIGESLPNTCGSKFFDPYGPDYFYAIHSIMLDYPYLGQRTFDVLRVLNWLKDQNHSQIHLVGKKWGALPAAFAALFSESVVQVTLKNVLTSYTEIAESEDYNWPLSILLPNVLRYFDLPDCYEALKKKNLRLVDPLGAGA